MAPKPKKLRKFHCRRLQGLLGAGAAAGTARRGGTGRDGAARPRHPEPLGEGGNRQKPPQKPPQRPPQSPPLAVWELHPAGLGGWGQSPAVLAPLPQVKAEEGEAW